MKKLFFAFIILLCSCAGSVPVNQETKQNATLQNVEAVVKVFDDPEKPISVAVGSKFAIVLESNRTTGYRWEYYSPGNAAFLKLLGIEYRASATGLVGSGGREVLMFEAVGKGKSEISLNYARPWGKDIPPAKSVTFKVNVEEN